MQNTRLCLHNVLAATGSSGSLCPVAILFLFLDTLCLFVLCFLRRIMKIIGSASFGLASPFGNV